MSAIATDGRPTGPHDPGFDPDLFKGTACYYARYRVPYPQDLLDDLLQRARISGDGRLLDLACGPGRAAIALAPHFSEVWAVDQEAEMIAAGRKEASRAQVANLRWLITAAEDVEAPDAYFELISIGEAFHRLNQSLIAQRALSWLKPGGHLATMGCFGVTSGKEAWQAILREIVRKWTARVSDAPSKPETRQSVGKSARKRGADHDQRLLEMSGFEDVRSYEFPHPHDWTMDSIVGNLFSTSTCSKQRLGGKAEAFEADLRHALLAHDSRGVYPERIRFGYTLARRPGRQASPP